MISEARERRLLLSFSFCWEIKALFTFTVVKKLVYSLQSSCCISVSLVLCFFSFQVKKKEEEKKHHSWIERLQNKDDEMLRKLTNEQRRM